MTPDARIPAVGQRQTGLSLILVGLVICLVSPVIGGCAGLILAAVAHRRGDRRARNLLLALALALIALVLMVAAVPHPEVAEPPR